MYFTGSRPTVLRNTPKLASMPAAMIWPRCASTTSTMPNSAARKISRLPKFGATFASTGASSIRHTTEIVPPTNEAE